MKKTICFLLISLFASLSGPACAVPQSPASVDTTKPWTYWWWMGSSVTEEGITRNLEMMADAGFGGVHIIPIYGEKGDEPNFIEFLSPRWMEVLRHTVDEAGRLGMGVDMTSGTGWPFGGPGIDSIYAAKHMDLRWIEDVKGFSKDHGKSTVGFAFYRSDNTLQWGYNSGGGVMPAKVLENAAYGILIEKRLTGQKVKRAAPGGEGLVIDPFSGEAVSYYMRRFEQAFGPEGSGDYRVRSFYNDSYEVYGANFTDRFMAEFMERRGYMLPAWLNALYDEKHTADKGYVVTDYCETISELLLENFAGTWVGKSRDLGMLTRYQAHGSPGNLLDLYACADIPETESFGSSGFNIPGLRNDPDYSEDSFGRPSPLTMKFASSAAHTNGKRLVSSETATWLGDHFKVTLAQVKPQVDELFVSGINHVFYHGVTYSPPEKEFPGRLFYASTNFGPHSHFWKELPLLNRYIADCQSILQRSAPDNDVLLYFAIHDIWNKLNTKDIIRLFDVHKSTDWLQSQATGRLAQKLWDGGYSFDYVSDLGITGNLSFGGESLTAAGGKYKALLVPSVEVMPVETLAALLELARQGAHICFEERIPDNVPGLNEREERLAEAARLKTELLGLPNVRIIGEPGEAGIAAEELAGSGLSFIRKKLDGNTVYFITNLSDRFTEGFVELCTKGRFYEIYDPLTSESGHAITEDGEIYLQLPPGMSCFVTISDKSLSKKTFPYYENGGPVIDISRDWQLIPVDGAPAVPAPVTMDSLVSWTELGGDFRYFGGTVKYVKRFDLPDNALESEALLLRFGDLRETAKITVNGRYAGTVWSIPSQLRIPAEFFGGKNTIDIDVANVSFNRVIDLDRRKVPWKNFHEINFVNILYKPYDASDAEPVDSGIIGSLVLEPCVMKTRD